MRPGEIVPAWDDGGHGSAIILATSRHRTTIGHADAAARLADHAAIDLIGRDGDPGSLRALLADRRTSKWYSVTESEDHECMSDIDCEGGWCSEGAGAAWVEVLHISDSEVYELLDGPLDAPRGEQS